MSDKEQRPIPGGSASSTPASSSTPSAASTPSASSTPSAASTPSTSSTPSAPSSHPVDAIVDTDQIPIVTDGQPAESNSGSGGAHRRKGERNWKYIKGTRIRTSTAIVLVAFFGAWVLYGFSSQRYLDDQPSTTPHVTQTTEPTYREPTTTTESRPSVSSSEPSVTTESSDADTQTEDGQNGGSGTETTTTTGGWLPTLPQVPGRTTTTTAPTTTVPTR